MLAKIFKWEGSIIWTCCTNRNEEDAYTRLLKSREINFSLDAPNRKLSLGPALVADPIFDRRQPAPMDIVEIIKAADAPVILHVYSVGHKESIQKLNNVAQNYLHEGGVFHGAIEVSGKEWSYGSVKKPGVCGMFSCEPMKCSMHTFRESFYLGDCQLEPAEVKKILVGMKREWMGEDYDLIRKNCCSFSEAFALKLGVGHIPDWVNRLAKLGTVIEDEVEQAMQLLQTAQDDQVASCDKNINAVDAEAGNHWMANLPESPQKEDGKVDEQVGLYISSMKKKRGGAKTLNQ